MRLPIFVLALGCLVAHPVAGAQTLRLKPRVETPTDGYDQVVARYAKRGGTDYAGLSADADAKSKLSAYLAWAANMPEEAGLADWLNAYNATVLASVLSALPLASVRDDPAFFATRRHRIAGKERTLDDIENRIVRPRFHDARVHFALNCGARSCPALRPRAFRSAGLDAALDELTRAALRDAHHVRVTAQSLELSALFFWFEADFVRDAGSVRAFVRKYVAPAEAGRITDALPLAQRDYDWSLNSAPGAAKHL